MRSLAQGPTYDETLSLPPRAFQLSGKKQQGGKIMGKLLPSVIKQASAGKTAFLSPSTVAMLLLREMW